MSRSQSHSNRFHVRAYFSLSDDWLKTDEALYADTARRALAEAMWATLKEKCR